MKLPHRRDNRALSLLLLAGIALATPAVAQGAHDAGTSPMVLPGLTSAQRAAKRFPQPVRVGDLTDRQVLEPSNRQVVLGRVQGVARGPDGALLLVVRYGGVLGIGTRPIAVPVDATTLLGPFMQIVDIPEADVKSLPTYTGAGATPLGNDEVIRIGVNRN